MASRPRPGRSRAAPISSMVAHSRPGPVVGSAAEPEVEVVLPAPAVAGDVDVLVDVAVVVLVPELNVMATDALFAAERDRRQVLREPGAVGGDRVAVFHGGLGDVQGGCGQRG